MIVKLHTNQPQVLQQMNVKYNLQRNTVQKNSFFLPQVINHKGQHRSSFLLQPGIKIKSKKTVASRKNDWLNYTLMQKLSFIQSTKNQNRKNEIKVKNNYHPKPKCLTQQSQQSKQLLIKQFIIYKFKEKNRMNNNDSAKSNSLTKSILNSIDLEAQNFVNKDFLVGDIKEKVKLNKFDFINKRVKRFTSVCSSHNKSVTEMMQPVLIMPLPKVSKSKNQFTIQPWSFDKQND